MKRVPEITEMPEARSRRQRALSIQSWIATVMKEPIASCSPSIVRSVVRPVGIGTIRPDKIKMSMEYMNNENRHILKIGRKSLQSEVGRRYMD